MVADYKHIIQRIRYPERKDDGSRYGYRACYLTLDSTGEDLKFGQYARHLTEHEYRKLLRKGKAKGRPIVY